MSSAPPRMPTCNARSGWWARRWRHRRTARWPITQRVKCCARSRGAREAIPEFERAIALDRSRVPAYAHVGWCKFLTGSVDEAIPYFEQAIRLSPSGPGIAPWYGRLGVMQLLSGGIPIRRSPGSKRARSLDPRARHTALVSRRRLWLQRRAGARPRRTRRGA